MMIDWIKYTPLNLRDSEDRCSVRGPSFSLASRKSFRVDGNRIDFKWPSASWFMPGQQYDNFDGNHSLDSLSTRNGYFNKKWKVSHPASKRWRFDGPWFTGRLCDIAANIFLLSPVDLPEGSSLFHPQAFEHALAQRLSDERDGSLHRDAGTFIAPINWQPIGHSSVPAAKFESIWRTDSGPSISYCQALSDHILIEFNFLINTPNVNQWLDGRIDKVIDREPLMTLIDQVIDSIKVELSPENAARLEEVKKQAPDAKLSESFPPIKWSDEQAEESALLDRAAL